MNGIEWTNDEKFDAFLRDGLLIANQSSETIADVFDYSQKYKRWEQKLLGNPLRFAKRKRRPAYRRALDVAAAVLIILTVIFGSLIAISPDVRAAVLSWFREVFATHDAIRFTQQQDGRELGYWRPSYLPEGYVETNEIDLFTQIIVDFENDTGERITLIYKLLQEGMGFNIDNEDMEIIETMIGTHVAYLYCARIDTKQSTVILMNEDVGIAFEVSSFDPYETLVRIAESIVLIE